MVRSAVAGNLDRDCDADIATSGWSNADQQGTLTLGIAGDEPFAVESAGSLQSPQR